MSSRCPLWLRLFASVSGLWFVLLNPSWKFFLPTTLAIFITYPWLHRRLMEVVTKKIEPDFYRLALTYSFYASIISAILICITHIDAGIARIDPESWFKYSYAFVYLFIFHGLEVFFFFPISFGVAYLIVRFTYYALLQLYPSTSAILAKQMSCDHPVSKPACPIKLRSLLSLVIGILCPSLVWFGLEHEEIYEAFVTPSLSGFDILLDSVLTPTVFIVVSGFYAHFYYYPWLYLKIAASLDSNSRPRYFIWGIAFGFATAGIALGIFIALMIVLTIIHMETVMRAAGFASMFAIMFFVFLSPIILLLGTLYAWANYVFIKKYYHSH